MACPDTPYLISNTHAGSFVFVSADLFDIPDGATDVTFTTSAALSTGPALVWNVASRFIGGDGLPLSSPPGAGAFGSIFANSYSLPHSISKVIPTGAVAFQLELNCTSSSKVPQTFVTISGMASFAGSCVDPGYCAYGTQRNPDAQIYSFVTAALIDAVVLALGWPAMVLLFFDTLIGAPLLFPSCENQPPPTPTFTTDDFVGDTSLLNLSGLAKAKDLFAVGLWYFYCQCVPAPGGEPPPLPFPPPDLTGTGFTTNPNPPPIVCDNGDICATLNRIQDQLAALTLLCRLTRQDVTTIQRFHVPMAYIPGGTWLGLTATGSIDVSRAIGFQIVLDSVPDGTRTLEGDPVYLWNVGWMAISDPAGMIAEKRITRQSMTWIPEDAQLATTFTYYLWPGVQMSMLELMPEH